MFWEIINYYASPWPAIPSGRFDFGRRLCSPVSLYQGRLLSPICGDKWKLLSPFARVLLWASDWGSSVRCYYNLVMQRAKWCLWRANLRPPFPRSTSTSGVIKYGHGTKIVYFSGSTARRTTDHHHQKKRWWTKNLTWRSRIVVVEEDRQVNTIRQSFRLASSLDCI